MLEDVAAILRIVQDHPLLRQVRLVATTRDLLPVYLVGGFIRDTFLDRPQALDIDLVSVDASSLGAVLQQCFDGKLVSLAQGVCRVVFSHRGEQVQMDVSPLRGGSITEDLRRRDFTINALAISLGETHPSIIDPGGGLRDIEQKRIRMSDHQVLIEDPLRLLRSVRLAAHLGFEIDGTTAQAIRHEAWRLSHVAPERLREEFFGILHCVEAGRWLAVMDEHGLFEALLPETRAMRGCLQGPPHRFDVLTHSLETVRSLDRILVGLPTLLSEDAALLSGLLKMEIEGGITRQALLRFIALLHDVGKPQTRVVEGGHIRFLRHAERGANLVHEINVRLRVGSRASAMTVALVRHHLRPLLLRKGKSVTPRARYRFWRELGALAVDLLLLSLADLRATAGEEWDEYRAHVQFVREMFAFRRQQMQAAEGTGLGKSFLNGHQLMAALDLAPGPFVGFLLDRVREEASLGTFRDEAEALAYLRRNLRALQEEFTGGNYLDRRGKG